MAPSNNTPNPAEGPKPLKILTIDGGGLQAVSTLLILNKVLETIGKLHSDPPRKPKPCEVFDTIAGIGAGGWLAILLGRFRMDITTCLSEWYKITRHIEPRSRSKELRLRYIHQCYFDTERLIEEVDRLTRTYGTGDYLLEDDPEGARTRHVFVAALKADAKGYRLFRTYETPRSAKLKERLLEGPADPKNYKISSAFGVTGAAKYFTKEWNEHMEHSGHTKFIDSKFPKPHNITELALDEMWAIYGTDVPLSVVVNIGPGLPNDVDVKQIARRFSSWGLNLAGATPRKRARLPAIEQEPALRSQNNQTSVIQPDEVEQDVTKPSVRFPKAANMPNTSEHKHSIKRIDTVGSLSGRNIDEKLKRCEDEIERDIKKKLNYVRPGSGNLYYRLALPKAPQGTARNDSSAAIVAHDATMDYLDRPAIDRTICEVAERIPKIASAA